MIRQEAILRGPLRVLDRSIRGGLGKGHLGVIMAPAGVGKTAFLVQVGLAKNPHMPNVPFIFDYAKSDEDRQIFRLVFGWLDLERPIGAPPGVPEERLRALREGFDRAMKDPALLADAEKAQVGIEPMSGSEIAAFVDEAYRAPAEIGRRAAQMLGRGAQ